MGVHIGPRGPRALSLKEEKLKAVSPALVDLAEERDLPICERVGGGAG